jgi:hypothetical protein
MFLSESIIFAIVILILILMKKFVILLLFVLTLGRLMDAQEKLHFTIYPQQDTIVVYDAHENVVLLYGKDVFVYRQTPVKVTKAKKEIIFSSSDGELGRVSSKRYRKIHLADGSVYTLASGKKKLSYKKEGHVCVSSEYSFGSAYPYSAGKVDVEMSVDADLNLIPFLFQSVLAHIRGTEEAERMFWIMSMQSLF